MSLPIVLVAFGTTTEAVKTYRFMDAVFREVFPDDEIIWAYSSRMVKDRIKQSKNIDLKHPHQVISELVEQGQEWVVVQSLHLICGHEFYRMVEEVRQMPVRTSIGLPLFAEPRDYHDTVKAFEPVIRADENTAYIFVGHGTDHPAWTSYVALEWMFRKEFGDNIFVGVVEGTPSRAEVVDTVARAGFKRAHLIPLMLVAGTHFYEDLVDDEDSWKRALEQRGISVVVEEGGLGYVREIVEIFCRHIRAAVEAVIG